MKQSRATSLLKSSVSTAVGFLVALAANATVLPLFGFHPTLSENLQLTSLYTVISVALGYLLERAFEALGWRTRMSAFAIAVLAERERQKTEEGFQPEHDDNLPEGELARAGACYALWRGGFARGSIRTQIWPWRGLMMRPYNLRRDLVRAAALILAEGERADRMRSKTPSPGAASEPEIEERRTHAV